MPTSEPLHVAFVWHMHQPYYRSALSGSFHMPWARMHALKDYLGMVETLSQYPRLHQTFNLVPSLVEQLADYASGTFVDDYWQHTLTPASELQAGERTFVVERMCEHSDHPRARAHPRYLELALKREGMRSSGWDACAASFSTDEIRDLQIWFNLAWFDPAALAQEPLRSLVQQGQHFSEEDKRALAEVQAAILSRTLPAYREAVARGQIELSTSPYFHPILPLLCDSDSARVASPDVALPTRRFAHPEDAFHQLTQALLAHERFFGVRPRGLWCSEQAVGENILPLLLKLGVEWTISDESVLARSLSGAIARPRGHHMDSTIFGSPYVSYRLTRGESDVAMVFRDHTLSDLIGFTYKSWDSREAAADFLRRLRELRDSLASVPDTCFRTRGARGGPISASLSGRSLPLVVIALDGENAWEHYPGNGRDFLQYLYEGLDTDDSLRSVTISEHLREAPPSLPLDWLHTGSWIAADLLTWCGSPEQNKAWALLQEARDALVRRDQPAPPSSLSLLARPSAEKDPVAAAWHHILVTEGSDWFWWFGDRHHTDLDSLWDLHFRLHLQEVYRLLGEPVPRELLVELTDQTPPPRPTTPSGALAPDIDGVMTEPSEWASAGYLVADARSTMQPSLTTHIEEVRFGWQGDRLCLLVVPGPSTVLEGLELELSVSRTDAEDLALLSLVLLHGGQVDSKPMSSGLLATAVLAAWKDVVEICLPLDPSVVPQYEAVGLLLRVGREGETEHLFRTVLAVSPGEVS